LQGLEIGITSGATVEKGGDEQRGVGQRRGRQQPLPITIVDPPTFIRIVAPADEPITFYGEQRRYIRIETDAESRYHNPANRDLSQINIVIDGGQLNLSGTTPLKDGRLRLIIDCGRDATVNDVGAIRVELLRRGLATLSDSRGTVVVRPPETKPKTQQVELPPFDVRPVHGPEDPMWAALGWPDNPNEIASSTVEEEGKLIVYYSTVFPRFTHFRTQLERKENSLGASFANRYEIWLAVHSLILYQDQQTQEQPAARSEEDEELADRNERCRVAMLSAMFAAKEVQRPDMQGED
jgi:hypothetical protein